MMAIVGFNFTQINAERKSVPKGKINIENNISIKNVSKANINMGTNVRDGLRYEFEASIKYEPNIGHIIFKGDFLDMDTPEQVKKVLDMWKDNKKLPDDVKNTALAHILQKSLIEAILISRDINMPPPIKIGATSAKKTNKYIG